MRPVKVTPIAGGESGIHQPNVAPSVFGQKPPQARRPRADRPPRQSAGDEHLREADVRPMNESYSRHRRSVRQERCAPTIPARSVSIVYRDETRSIRVCDTDTLNTVVTRAFDHMHGQRPPYALTTVSVGTDRLNMEGYIGLGEVGRWDTPLLAAMNITDTFLELHHQASSTNPNYTSGVSGARDEFTDDTGRELLRLERSLNPYSILNVPLDAGCTEILTAYQRLMLTTRDPGVANEHLAPHYQSAYDIIGDPALRVMYDALSLTGQTDCSQIFTSSESKLLVRSSQCSETSHQLKSIWRAKQCHALKVLVTDMGSHAGTLAVVLAELRRKGADSLFAFIRAGSSRNGVRTAVTIGFENTDLMCTAIEKIGSMPRPQRARNSANGTDWKCPGCQVSNWASRNSCFKCNLSNPSPSSSAPGRGHTAESTTTSAYVQFRFGLQRQESDIIIVLGEQPASVTHQTTLFRDDSGMDNTSQQMAVSTSQGYGTTYAPEHESGDRRYWGQSNLIRREAYPGQLEDVRQATVLRETTKVSNTDRAVTVANAQTEGLVSVLIAHTTADFGGGGDSEYMMVHLNRHYQYVLEDDAPLVPSAPLHQPTEDPQFDHYLWRGEDFVLVERLLYLSDCAGATVKANSPDKFLIRWRNRAEAQADMQLNVIDVLSGLSSDYYAVVLVGLGYASVPAFLSYSDSGVCHLVHALPYPTCDGERNLHDLYLPLESLCFRRHIRMLRTTDQISVDHREMLPLPTDWNDYQMKAGTAGSCTVIPVKRSDHGASHGKGKGGSCGKGHQGKGAGKGSTSFSSALPSTSRDRGPTKPSRSYETPAESAAAVPTAPSGATASRTTVPNGKQPARKDTASHGVPRDPGTPSGVSTSLRATIKRTCLDDGSAPRGKQPCPRVPHT